MRFPKLLLIIFCLLFLCVGPSYGYSTHDTTISRPFDKAEAGVNDPITITVTFTNLEANALRGFYYADQIPEGLSINPVSVRIGGNDASSYIVESGSSGDVYAGYIPYRWVLEAPTAFEEDNPVPQDSTVEIVYSVSSSQAGTFHLDEFHWVGYYQNASEGERAAFGHSEETDKKTITFFERVGPFLVLSGLGEGSIGYIEAFTEDYSHGDWLRIAWWDYNSANGEARLATGDIDGDGRDEIVIGLGPVDGEPSIPGGYFQVLDDDYTHLAWGRIDWPSYNKTNGESWPACGDIDGDGRDEIIVGLGPYPAYGGWLEVFDYDAGDMAHKAWIRVIWELYNSESGETRPACGDIDGDGRDEIVVGFGPVSGEPSIPGGWFQVLDDDYTRLAWGQINWGAYNSANGESWPACGDTDGDGKDEIIIGLGPYPADGGWFEVFDYARGDVTRKAWKRINWGSYNNLNGETRPASGDLDGDGKDEIVVGLGQGGGGWMEIFDDAPAGHAHFAWILIHWKSYCVANGETWPAVKQ